MIYVIINNMKYFLITLLSIISFFCYSQTKGSKNLQIAQYVVETFQDSKNNLWFGTLEKGVAKFNGKKLVYLTTKDGLPSNRIVSIIEDNKGYLWFGTGKGLAKFNGKSFTNYTEKEGLCSNMISNIFIDSKKTFWIGTWNGVCKFDGKSFKNFPIPNPKVKTKINEDTKNWITEITEDSTGNIWFAKDGFGATKYDGNKFFHYSKENGFPSNCVTEIEEDSKGNIWFGFRIAEKNDPNIKKQKSKGGIAKINGKKLNLFSEIKKLSNSEVYEIYKDKHSNIWIATTKNGVYKYNGDKFINYPIPISIMSITQDNKENFWLGGAGGLYKINSKGIIKNITLNNFKN